MIKIQNKDGKRIFLVIVLLAFISRLPLVGSVWYRSPDAIEYVNVAENINRGSGLAQSIKWHYFEDAPVLTNALQGKPVGFSVLVAGWLKLFPNRVNLQFLIFGLFAAGIGVFYLIVSESYGQKWAGSLAALAIINPNLLIVSRLVVSEWLFVFLILLTLLIVQRQKRGWQVVAGIVLVAAFWTRFEAVLLLPLVWWWKKDTNFALNVPIACHCERKRSNLLRKIATVSAQGGSLAMTGVAKLVESKPWVVFFVFGTLVAPMFLVNWQLNGSPFYSYNQFHWQVKAFAEGMSGFVGQSFPSAREFIGNNWQWVIGQVGRNIYGELKVVFGIGAVGALPILLIRSKISAQGRSPPKGDEPWDQILGRKKQKAKIAGEIWWLVVFAALLIILFALFWSAFFEPERHLLLGVFAVLLLIPVVWGQWGRVAKTAIVGATVGIWLILDIHRVTWATTVDVKDIWQPPETAYVLPKGAIVACPNPWMAYLITNQPTILLPDKLSEVEREGLIVKYRVTHYLTLGGCPSKSTMEHEYQSREYRLCRI